MDLGKSVYFETEKSIISIEFFLLNKEMKRKQ